MERKELESLVSLAIKEANSVLPEDAQLEPKPGAKLFGEGSKLDSLGTVNSVITIESYISSETGIHAGLSDLIVDAELHRISTFEELCEFIYVQLSKV